jgi:glucose-1-phosphate thymidylyltransferase
VKAVVLAAGLGSRMQRPDPGADLDAMQRSAADHGVKALVPIGGRPFLDYALSRLADAGIRDVVLVVGKSTRAIRDRYEATPPERVRLAFAEQAEPRGSADALLAAEGFVVGGDQDFLAMNSDDLYPLSSLLGLLGLGRAGLPVFERGRLLATSNFSEKRVAAFAVLRLGGDGFLEGIVEKPDPVDVPGSGQEVLLSMNLWRFPSAIFDACRRVPDSVRGERELPQAVGLGIAAGLFRLATFRCDDPVLDLTTRADVAAVTERLRGVEARP